MKNSQIILRLLQLFLGSNDYCSEKFPSLEFLSKEKRKKKRKRRIESNRWMSHAHLTSLRSAMEFLLSTIHPIALIITLIYLIIYIQRSVGIDTLKSVILVVPSFF